MMRIQVFKVADKKLRKLREGKVEIPPMSLIAKLIGGAFPNLIVDPSRDIKEVLLTIVLHEQTLVEGG